MASQVTDITPSQVRHGSLILDMLAFKLICEGRSEFLTLSQARLLAVLMREPAKVHSNGALTFAMKGENDSGEHALKVSISRLRCSLRRLSAANEYLHSVRGVGYIFDPTTI